MKFLAFSLGLAAGLLVAALAGAQAAPVAECLHAAPFLG